MKTASFPTTEAELPERQNVQKQPELSWEDSWGGQGEEGVSQPHSPEVSPAVSAENTMATTGTRRVCESSCTVGTRLSTFVS